MIVGIIEHLYLRNAKGVALFFFFPPIYCSKADLRQPGSFINLSLENETKHFYWPCKTASHDSIETKGLEMQQQSLNQLHVVGFSSLCACDRDLCHLQHSGSLSHFINVTYKAYIRSKG